MAFVTVAINGKHVKECICQPCNHQYCTITSLWVYAHLCWMMLRGIQARDTLFLA